MVKYCAIDGSKVGLQAHKIKDGIICHDCFTKAGLDYAELKRITVSEVTERINAYSTVASTLEDANGNISKTDVKTLAFLQKNGLTNLPKDVYKQVQGIANDMVGNGLIKAGLALSFSNAADQAKISYLSAITQQNWIMIRQNEEIIHTLKSLKTTDSEN